MLRDARLQPLDCAGQDKEQNGVISAVAPLMFLEAEASGRSHILRYGIVRNTLENAAELPPDTKVLACNEQGYEFIYEASDHNVSGLEVTGRGVHRRELLRINQHLSDIDPGEAVPLSYIGSNGQKLTSWLLLPPGAVKWPRANNSEHVSRHVLRQCCSAISQIAERFHEHSHFESLSVGRARICRAACRACRLTLGMLRRNRFAACPIR